MSSHCFNTDTICPNASLSLSSVLPISPRHLSECVIASFHSSLFDIFFICLSRVFFVSAPLSYGISLFFYFLILSFSVSLSSYRILLPIALSSVAASFCLLNLSILNVCEENSLFLSCSFKFSSQVNLTGDIALPSSFLN